MHSQQDKVQGLTNKKTVWSVLKEAAAQSLAKLSGLSLDQIVPLLDEAKSDDAHFALALPKLKKYQLEESVASQWLEQFKPDDYLSKITKVEIGEGGRKLNVLNLSLNTTWMLKEVLTRVFTEKEKYGSTDELRGQTIVVEYSSPNIAKPFHAGHLRSTIIGNFLKNLLQFFGAKVISVNYLGDWGKQYGLLAVGFSKYGKEEELQKNAIRHLFDVYVAVNKEAKENEALHEAARAYFKKMEDGDPEALKLWERFRSLSIEEYKKIYARLNVHFDVYTGESQQSEHMKRALKILNEKGLLTKAENGALVVDLTKYKLGVSVIMKKDGATLYITRDLGAAISRYEQWHFDKMIYVVAASQDLHFKQVFKILELMGFDWVSKCVHVNFGMVLGMKTREGDVVFLEDILNEAQHIMLQKMQEDVKGKLKEIENPEAVADRIGVSAVVVQDLGAKRIKNYSFDWKRITTFEGHTGPYLQYAHARLCSMEDKTKDVPLTVDVDYSLLKEKAALDLAFQIARYGEILQLCLKYYEPSTLVTYLFELAAAISLAHQHLRVKDQEPNLAKARKLLFYSARVVLANGLTLLGLTPEERM
jgi:arginyl-tRNA synthetase